MRVRLIFLFALTVSVPLGMAITDLYNDHKGKAKQLWNTYRAATEDAENKRQIEFENRSYPFYHHQVPCSDCPALGRATRQVNDVLKALAKNESDQKRLEILGEVGKLEGVVHIMRDERGGCRRLTFSADIEDVDSYLNQDLTLIFDKEFPLGNFVHGHMLDGEIQHYIYRGRDEDKDKIVRISKEAGKPARIYYYVIKPNQKKKSKMIPAPRLPELPNKSKKNKNVYNVIGNTDSLPADDQGEYLRYGVGVEHKNKLPKKVIILEGKGSTKPIEGSNLRLTGEVEVSSSDQEASVTVSGSKRDYVKVGVNSGEEVTVEVPYQFTITDLVISNKLSGSLDTHGDSQIHLGSDIELDPNSKIRIQLEDNRNFGGRGVDEQKVWVGYQWSF